MTKDDKLHQLSGDWHRLEILRFALTASLGYGAPFAFSGRNERLGVPPFAFTDGPRGVNVGRPRTCYPCTMARGASFDRALERRVGEAMAREARATGCNYSGAVCVNLLRHPGWGRAQEPVDFFFVLR